MAEDDERKPSRFSLSDRERLVRLETLFGEMVKTVTSIGEQIAPVPGMKTKLDNQSRLLWAILTAVVGSLVTLAITAVFHISFMIGGG